MFENEKSNSDITAPLRTLLRKDQHFKFTDECKKVFIQLKASLTNYKVLAHWVQGRSTKLVVDSGSAEIAATLYQKNSDTLNWNTINYASHALTTTEQQYPAIEGEV